MSEPAKLYHGTTLLAVACFILLVVGVSGCATPGDVAAKAKPVTPQAVGLAADVAVPRVDAHWWQALGDPALDALVDRALAEQPSLQLAASRITRAQAQAESAGAAGQPQVGLGANVTRQLYSANGLFPPPLGGNFINEGTLQASASWELDFFGRNRAALQAALGAQQAAAADADAARTLLAAQVTRGWLSLARLLSQREVAKRALAQREQVLQLTSQRVDAGLDTNVELRQSQGALPDTRGQIEAFDEQIALARHQLAVLSAQPPNALDDARPRLADLRITQLPAGLGIDLLGRRPDVAAARWRVEAATQDVASARAEFYPDIRLSAFIGLDSLNLGRLFTLGSRTFGGGPAVHLPLFDGGRLRANLRGKTADLDAAIDQYNAALLQAVREVADGMTTQQSLERQRREQAAALDRAESAYDLALQRYRAGLGNYLVVLSAETQVLAQRRLAVDLQARVLDNQVVLAQSLGGGWQAVDSTASPATALPSIATPTVAAATPR
jgi:NodT family efflux transporter outer membrane factor (OMF) lipoprotein